MRRCGFISRFEASVLYWTLGRAGRSYTNSYTYDTQHPRSIMTTPALKFRDMILSKFASTETKASSEPSDSSSASSKSRLSFSVDSLLKKKFSTTTTTAANGTRFKLWFFLCCFMTFFYRGWRRNRGRIRLWCWRWRWVTTRFVLQ